MYPWPSHHQMRGSPKQRTTTGWLGHLSYFPTVGTPPAERAFPNFPGEVSASARQGDDGHVGPGRSWTIAADCGCPHLATNTLICASIISARFRPRVQLSLCRDWLNRIFWCRLRPSPRFDSAGREYIFVSGQLTHDGTGWNVERENAAPFSLNGSVFLANCFPNCCARFLHAAT